MDDALTVLGVSPVQEQVLRASIQRASSTAEDLEAATGLSLRHVRTALTALQKAGLVRRGIGRPPTYTAAQPDLAVEALIRRREEELHQARLAAAALMEHYRSLADPSASDELVEVISTGPAVGHFFEQMQRSARTEMVGMDRPPYPPGGPVFNETEVECLARGVRYRALYERSILEQGGESAVARYQAAGEQARMMPSLPMKLAMADKTVAILPLHRAGMAAEGAIVVHPSPLLDAVVTVFELLWSRAAPLAFGSRTDDAGAEHGPFDAQDLRLLSMLSAGLKDEAIARQLQVNVRTVVRRVAGLMQELGAETRFQAGLQAGKRGLL